MNSIKLIIVAAFTICTSHAKCQTNFLPGYYLKTKTDTVRGLIEYLSESRNARFCVFKATEAAKAITLYPGDVIGYCISNKQWFESHTAVEKGNRKVVGFFRVLVLGRLSLLAFQSKHFVEINDSIYDISKTEEIVEGKLIEDFRGLGILKSLIHDCPEVDYFKVHRNVTVSDYVDIVTKYNSCKGNSSRQAERIKIKPKFSLGLQASPTLTTLKLTSGALIANITNDLHFKAGIFVSCFIPKMNENIRLVGEASIGEFNNYSFFWNVNSNNDLFVKYSYLELPVLLRFGKGIFVDLGINNQFILSQNQSWRIEKVTPIDVQTENGQPNPLHSWTSGVLLGMGLQRNLFHHSIRYIVRMNAFRNHNETYQSIEFKVSYQLTKR